MFVGRKYEIDKLNELYSYVCKKSRETRLLTEFCKGKNRIFYVSEEYNDLLSLAKFSSQVL